MNTKSIIFISLIAILLVLQGNSLRADGFVDELNIIQRSDKKLDVKARGWAASDVTNDTLISVEIFLNQKLAISGRVEPYPRPDVVSITGNSDWLSAGWLLEGISSEPVEGNKWTITAVAHFSSGAKKDLIYPKITWEGKPAFKSDWHMYVGIAIGVLTLLPICILVIKKKRLKSAKKFRSPSMPSYRSAISSNPVCDTANELSITRYFALSRFSTWILVIFIMGSVYVANTWSPSSYGWVLNWVGAGTTPVMGSVRAIRSDEWAVRTPLTQALVNNGFARYNATSIYKEDLRIHYGLPIFDWGLIFKPACWGYLLLPPAYAFSFFYYFLFSLFIFGYALLFKRMGFDVLESLLIASALYFSATIQFWWSSGSEIFAYFPWVLLLISKTKTKPLLAIPLFWILVCWQLSNFYPPYAYILCFVGIAWLWLVKGIPSNWKSIGATCIASCLAVAVVLFYLRDYLQAMSGTSYPGMRSFQGGTAASWYMLPTHIFPTLLFGADYKLMDEMRGGNICESGTWATLLPLMMIFFCKGDINKLTTFIRANWLPIMIMLLMLAWITLPIPAGVARLIALNQVSPNRVLSIFGLLLTLILMDYGKHLDWQITYKRIMRFWGFYIVIIAIYKMNWPDIQADVLAAVASALLMAFCLWLRRPTRELAMVGIALFALMRFAPFNPIQSAKPIFSPPHLGLYNTLEECVKIYGYVNYGGPGAVINGFGFPSVAHVNTTPQMDFWNKKFPLLNPIERNFIFNRYAHIQLIEENFIQLKQADLIFVPRDCFLTPNDPSEPCTEVKIKE